MRGARIGLSEAILGTILLFTFLLMAQLSPQFLTSTNLLQLPRFMTEVGLIALGMTLIILTGGIDLSVGAIVGLAAVVLGALYEAEVPLPGAIMGALIVGVVAGSMNGFLIAYLRMPPLIATLATMAIFRGLAFGISQGRAYRDYPDWFYTLGQGYVGPFPTQVPLLLGAAIVFAFLLSKTPFGRKIYAIGNNETATRFAGHDVDQVKFLLYSLSGGLSAMAAVLLVSRFSTAKADLGQGFELDAITAVVLGGTSISGGTGGVWGTVLGLLVVGAIRNGMTLAFINTDIQQMAIGAALIAAVTLNQVFGSLRLRRKGVRTTG
jgi:rhamnose transport system permease protein